MSHFYLCDHCDNMDSLVMFLDEHIQCAELGVVKKRVMFDYHGKGGKRYDEPTDVCPVFKGRKDA